MNSEGYDCDFTISLYMLYRTTTADLSSAYLHLLHVPPPFSFYLNSSWARRYPILKQGSSLEASQVCIEDRSQRWALYISAPPSRETFANLLQYILGPCEYAVTLWNPV